MYEVYISNLKLPVAPGAISTDIPNRDEVVDLVNGREFNRLYPVGLKELSFSALLPFESSSFPGTLTDAFGWDAYHELERIKTEGVVFNFLILKPHPRQFGPLGFYISYATIGELKLSEDAAELGMNLKVDLTIKEHVFKTNTKVDWGKKQEDSTQRPVEVATVNQSYTVKKGDTLESIARQCFGETSNGASLIYQTNKTAIDDRAAKDGQPKGYLAEGMVLTIPPYARPTETQTNVIGKSNTGSSKGNSATLKQIENSMQSPSENELIQNRIDNFVTKAKRLDPRQPLTYTMPGISNIKSA